MFTNRTSEFVSIRAGHAVASERRRVHSWFPICCLALVLMGVASRAETYKTLDDALREAFPDAAVTRGTVALTEAQAARVTELSDENVDSLLVYPYTATRDGAVVGTAYFDAHRVRTLPETLMVVVDPSGRVARVEVLAFHEPREYLAPPPWLERWIGRELNEDLMLRRDVDGITGATLTARSVTKAVRQILAIHQALHE